MSDEDIKPNFATDGVPHCSYEDCPSYDGKRCRATGSRPDGICEPAVAELISSLHLLRGCVASLRSLVVSDSKFSRADVVRILNEMMEA